MDYTEDQTPLTTEGTRTPKNSPPEKPGKMKTETKKDEPVDLVTKWGNLPCSDSEVDEEELNGKIHVYIRLLCVHDKGITAVNNVTLLIFIVASFLGYNNTYQYMLPDGDVAYDAMNFTVSMSLFIISLVNVVIQNVHPNLRAFCNSWHPFLFFEICIGGCPFGSWKGKYESNLPARQMFAMLFHILITAVWDHSITFPVPRRYKILKKSFYTMAIFGTYFSWCEPTMPRPHFWKCVCVLLIAHILLSFSVRFQHQQVLKRRKPKAVWMLKQLEWHLSLRAQCERNHSDSSECKSCLHGNPAVLLALDFENALLHQEQLERHAMLIYTLYYFCLLLLILFLRLRCSSDFLYDNPQIRSWMQVENRWIVLFNFASELAPYVANLSVMCLSFGIYILWDLWSLHREHFKSQ